MSTNGPGRAERTERVASVLARAAALSDELRSTIRDLEQILSRKDEELESNEQPREGE